MWHNNKRATKTKRKVQSTTTDALSQHTLATTALGIFKYLYRLKQASVARASVSPHMGVSILAAVLEAVGTELTAAVRIVLSPLGTL